MLLDLIFRNAHFKQIFQDSLDSRIVEVNASSIGLTSCSRWSGIRRIRVVDLHSSGRNDTLRRCLRLRSTDSGLSPWRSAGEASDAVCSVRNVARSASL